MPQVALHEHETGARLVRDDLLGFAIDDDVQRRCRTVVAFLQREHVDDVVRQHRDLVARHVDGRQARARDRVDRVAHDAERRRRDVHADPHAAVGRCSTENASSISVVVMSSIENADVARGRSSGSGPTVTDGREARAVREEFARKRASCSAATRCRRSRASAAQATRRAHRPPLPSPCIRSSSCPAASAARAPCPRTPPAACRPSVPLHTALDERLLALRSSDASAILSCSSGALVLAAPLAAEVDGRAVQAQHERRARPGRRRAEVFRGQRRIGKLVGRRAFPQNPDRSAARPCRLPASVRLRPACRIRSARLSRAPSPAARRATRPETRRWRDSTLPALKLPDSSKKRSLSTLVQTAGRRVAR